MPNRSAINLARRRGSSFLDRFINWALTIGRVIVILTEAIALSAFMYRFSLDRQIIDLHSKIKQEQQIVKLLNKNENIYRNLQNRLTYADKLSQQAPPMVAAVSQIFQNKPQDMTIDQISISKNQLIIQSSTHTTTNLPIFITMLKQIPGVINVAVDKVENKTQSSTITTEISAELHN